MPMGERGAVYLFLFLLFLSMGYSIYLPGEALGLLGLPAAVESFSFGVDGERSAGVSWGLVLSEPSLYFKNGWAYVLAEVENGGEDALSHVKVEATFLKESGGVLAREHTYINHLNPGEKKPCRLLTPEVEAIKGVRLALGEGTLAPICSRPLVGEILQVTSGGGGYLHVTGKVSNWGEEGVDLAKVIIQPTGPEGEPLDLGFFFLVDLKPGQEREFTSYCGGGEGYQSLKILFD